MAKNPSQRELKAFIEFAIRARGCMWGVIRESPPKSEARWRLYHKIFPSHVADVTQTRLNRAIAEARRNNELALMAPKLEALEKGLTKFALTFVHHPQGYRKPLEPSPLTNAINDLLPFVESSTDTRAGVKRKTPRRTKKSDPTTRDMELFGEWLKVRSYRKVGETFDISATAVGKHVRFVQKWMKRNRSVRPQQLPHDERGQVTNIPKTRRRKKDT